MANGTRRDFFSSMVDGLHGTALATLLGADLFSAAAARASGGAKMYDLTPKAPHFPAEGQERHPSVHERRAEPDGSVRPQAHVEAAGRARRPSRELSFAISNGKVAGTLFPSPFEFKRAASAAWRFRACCRIFPSAPTISR